MNLSELDFDLPDERIAQDPPDERDGARLMTLDRSTGAVGHRRFLDLPRLVREGDLVVLNDTRVLPARLEGRKPSGGRVELLLLEPAGSDEDTWRCLARSSKPLLPGAAIALRGGASAEVLGREDDTWIVRLRAEGGAMAAIERGGRLPLPPYIRRAADDPRERSDRERYQTVFARRAGAVAAPTAGLHFTPRVLEGIAAAGAETAFLTLHVGGGTFLPVRTERIEDHRMHAERLELPTETADAIRRARARGGRIVAVGTTVVRALESRADDAGAVRTGAGWCDLFVRPGHRFRVVDALVTNFHLPRSTLLLLVCAFAGKDSVLGAYREAVAQGYRFYSYGDAMWIA